ncbi:hypothetical protein CSHISOI_00396 [Colletotrichum shisoi]|uniref:Uncharacterized protein n=1 Tax=Colletotrichum shisoi TaxID=2078593 RepID=A0A5Q4C8B7_9PEZI|nr:hypothetical protein CSHISOI_00396 [Colletotrichum shisoi]
MPPHLQHPMPRPSWLACCSRHGSAEKQIASLSLLSPSTHTLVFTPTSPSCAPLASSLAS